MSWWSNLVNSFKRKPTYDETATYFIAPELKKLSSKEISKLLESYGLTATGYIDEALVTALTKDQYRKLSGFTIENPADLQECAKYVNNQIQKRLAHLGHGNLYSSFMGTYGNAWTMNSKFGDKLFDLYDSPDFNNNMSVNDLKKMIAQKHANLNYDYSLLRIGDVLGLQYNPSPNHEKARNEAGRPMNTHVGVVVGYTKKGYPIVSHNIHGTVYNEPLIKGTTKGGFVSSAYRPKYKEGGRLNYLEVMYYN